MTDAEEHPFFSDGKEVGAGDVFTEGDIGEIMFEEIADECPSFQVLGFEERRVFAS